MEKNLSLQKYNKLIRRQDIDSVCNWFRFFPRKYPSNLGMSIFIRNQNFLKKGDECKIRFKIDGDKFPSPFVNSDKLVIMDLDVILFYRSSAYSKTHDNYGMIDISSRSIEVYLETYTGSDFHIRCDGEKDTAHRNFVKITGLKEMYSDFDEFTFDVSKMYINFIEYIENSHKLYEFT